MTTSERALLDSNILVYSHQADSKFHHSARNLLRKGLKGELFLFVAPQVLSEFYAIITSPKRTTNPISSEQATMEVDAYVTSRNIQKIYPNEGTLNLTLDLLRRYRVKEQNVFDLQLVATMLSNGISHIYTYDQIDFSKYREIEVLSPDTVLQ